MATGWLFDLYCRGRNIVLWFIHKDGSHTRLIDPFTPEIYLSGKDLESCVQAMVRAGDGEAVGWTERRDFWTNQLSPVFAVRVLRPETWKQRLPGYAERFPRVIWNNADLMPEQVYCYNRDLFPLAWCEFEGDGDKIVSLRVMDDRWDTKFLAPPFRVVELSGEGSLLGKHPRLQSLSLSYEGQVLCFDAEDCLLEGFQHTLDRIDPDVIRTTNGDSFLFPLLYRMADLTCFPLSLDRDPSPKRKIITDGQSYFTYGRIAYQAPEYSLYGRWHLDAQNSFVMGHAGLEGLLETARLSRLPPQRIARRSIGTGITSIQLDIAYREGYLVPWKKTRPEPWKSANQLLQSDRGGMVYSPICGIHENVVELDFVSMYPAIMAEKNVSPETVNCGCCHNGKVPEIGYTICEKRRGLVSESLAPIIKKRIAYKVLREEAKKAGDLEAYNRYDERASALKWSLVCCFGYLGYRNARFGCIEAHESVSAYSREYLTVAREICEDRGWRLLHANVDSVWIVKPGFQRDEIELLCKAIDAATGLSIALEGVYNWIAFLPSRQVADRPVPTRYFGAFDDLTLKYRGVECRRHDIPLFIKEAQLTILKQLALATDIAAYRAMAPKILEAIAEMEEGLWRQEVSLDRLVVHQTLSQPLENYRGHGPQAIAARQALRAGLKLHGGEALDYIITSADNPDRERRIRLVALLDADATYDPVAYIRLLRRAMNTLLWPAGVTLEEKKITRTGAPKSRKKKIEVESLQIDLLASGSCF